MESIWSTPFFGSAADFSGETGKVQEGAKAWASEDGGKGSATAAEGRTAKAPQEKQRRRGAPRFAPEFDGVNLFETIVSR